MYINDSKKKIHDFLGAFSGILFCHVWNAAGVEMCILESYFGSSMGGKVHDSASATNCNWLDTEKSSLEMRESEQHL